MVTINCFEDLVIWQMAREVCRQIEHYAQSGIKSKNYSLADQIRRSSGSIMDNISDINQCEYENQKFHGISKEFRFFWPKVSLGTKPFQTISNNLKQLQTISNPLKPYQTN